MGVLIVEYCPQSIAPSSIALFEYCPSMTSFWGQYSKNNCILIFFEYCPSEAILDKIQRIILIEYCPRGNTLKILASSFQSSIAQGQYSKNFSFFIFEYCPWGQYSRNFSSFIIEYCPWGQLSRLDFKFLNLTFLRVCAPGEIQKAEKSPACSCHPF